MNKIFKTDDGRFTWKEMLKIIAISWTAAIIIFLPLAWSFGFFISYEKDCDYCIPAGYQLVYSPSKNSYAIKIKQYENYYLIRYDGLDEIDRSYMHIKEAEMFKDSCEAKGFLKAYLIQQLPKDSDFKELPGCPQ